MRLRNLAGVLALACSAQACAVGGLADLTVYDRTEGRRLPVHWHEGRAYVAGKPGNEYQISLRNNLGEDLLAVMSVDGVNILSGETADPSQGGYVLGARRTLDVQGWRKSLSQTAAFYFTARPDSYAARTGRPDDVGVIGVALFRRKPQEVSSGPAPIAGRGADSAKQAEAQIGTGHGRRETSHVRTVEFERATALPAQTVALYYDSYRNLVARGIIREPVPARAPLPRPFPGFVPDPA